ncbi:MAG: TetR family transcriptional regulator [Lysobacterales bacterium]
MMSKEQVLTPRRSDATRARILNAARERFALDGYERATIRAIAADAKADPALVMRYYGNKAGLFSAAIEFNLHIPDLTALPRRSVGTALVSNFIDLWEDDDTLKALLRAGATNEVAAERLRTIFAKQVAVAVAGVVPDRKSAEMRAGLSSSQFLGFALCRYLLKIPPVARMSRKEVIRWLSPTIQHYICGTGIPGQSVETK